MSMANKVMSMQEAIERFVRDGDTVFLGGLVAGEPYAAVHEIIRQRKKNLAVSKGAGVLILDMLIGAGCVRRAITSYIWNPVYKPAHAFRRAVEKGIPHPIELEEYSFLALGLAYFAGALDLPFVATKSLLGTDILAKSPLLVNRVKVIDSPFTGEPVALIGPLKHDVGIMHVQRVDEEGNAQAWGPLAADKWGIGSCSKVIITAEEIVPSDVIRKDPQRTIVPGFRVDAVVEEPWSSYPDYMPGYYDRDWKYFPVYYEATKTEEGFNRFLEEWVYGVKSREEYLAKIGQARLNELKAEPWQGSPVSYGYCATF
jgi:glutaconate CoA-transferase subunit A